MQEMDQRTGDARLAQVMFRGGTPEFQFRVSMLRQHLLSLSEISTSGTLAEMEKTYIDSLSLDKTLRGFHPDGAQFKAVKVTLEDGSKWLVLDVHGEESRSRSRVSTDFMIAMERPRDLSIDLLDVNNARLEDFDRLCWRLDPVVSPLAPVTSA